MKNPFHRLTETGTGIKHDVNMSHVMKFYPAGDKGTELVFINGERLYVTDSDQTVRGRARKTWPDQTTTTDHIEDGSSS